MIDGQQQNTRAKAGESRQDGEQAATEGFQLQAQTEEELKAKAEKEEAGKAAEAKAARDAENKAKADSEAKDFRLTGSNRTADVAAAGGQNSLFGANGSVAKTAAAPEAPRPNAESNPQPVEKAAPKASEKPKASVQDYGEKLDGARKYRQPSLEKALTDDDIRSQPLSKIWTR